MIDGIDGLSGSVSLASLALAAVIAHDGGSDVYVFLIVALMGGIGGFLYFNLRYPGNRGRGSFSATTAACCWVSSLPGCSLPCRRGNRRR
jgi:hypothetical protein